MTDTLKSRAVEATARAVCQERCAFMGEPPCWKVGEWPNTECDEPGCIAVATAALTALHRFATAEGARLWVPVVATKDMCRAAADRPTASAIGSGLYASVYAAMIEAAPDVLRTAMEISDE